MLVRSLILGMVLFSIVACASRAPSLVGVEPLFSSSSNQSPCSVMVQYAFATGTCVNDKPWNFDVDLSQSNDIWRRNELQNLLLARSTELCHRYTQSVTSRTRSGSLALRTAAAVLNGASTIISHQSTANALGATGTAATAIGTDFDDTFGRLVQIAVSGIELGRTRVFLRIRDSQSDSITEYPVTRAINDALRYHAQCDLIQGLENASGSLEDAKAKQRVSNEKAP